MPEIGKITKNSFDCESVKWKIPRASKALLEVDSELLSPCFSYKDADWSLKLHPYGRSNFQTEGWIDVVIERQRSEVLQHSFSYRIFLECQRERKTDILTGSLVFDESQLQRAITFFTSWSKIFHYDEKHKACDAITLVCEFQSQKNAKLEPESMNRNLGKEFLTLS